MSWMRRFKDNLLEVLYRDQPRDELGRFASTGGAGPVGDDTVGFAKDAFLSDYADVDQKTVTMYSTVAENMDRMTSGQINVQQIKRRLAASSEYYGQKMVNPKQLTIQDYELVGADPSKFSDEPIIVDKDGWVVDGRHRAKAALMRGDSEIKAWVPVRVPEG